MDRALKESPALSDYHVGRESSNVRLSCKLGMLDSGLDFNSPAMNNESSIA